MKNPNNVEEDLENVDESELAPTHSRFKWLWIICSRDLIRIRCLTLLTPKCTVDELESNADSAKKGGTIRAPFCRS